MKYMFITDQKEARPVHKGKRITVTETSGMEWVTWKGVKHFLHLEMFTYMVKQEIAKGRTKEEVLDEYWDIQKDIPQNA